MLRTGDCCSACTAPLVRNKPLKKDRLRYIYVAQAHTNGATPNPTSYFTISSEGAYSHGACHKSKTPPQPLSGQFFSVLFVAGRKILLLRTAAVLLYSLGVFLFFWRGIE